MRSTKFGGFSSRSTVAPATMALMVTIGACFLVNWATVGSQPLLQALAFSTSTALSKPWTFLTYAFALPGQAIMSAVFGTLWLWMVGTFVERDIGIANYLGAFFGFGVLGAGLVMLASQPTGPYLLIGSTIPVGVVTMLWGARNPNQTIRFFGIIPMSAKVLCIFTAVFSFLGMGLGTPLMGVAALIPMALAWAWASQMLPVRYPVASTVSAGAKRSAAEAKREREKFSSYIDDVRAREAERAEKDRLRELFERSLIEDPEDREKRG